MVPRRPAARPEGGAHPRNMGRVHRLRTRLHRDHVSLRGELPRRPRHRCALLFQPRRRRHLHLGHDPPVYARVHRRERHMGHRPQGDRHALSQRLVHHRPARQLHRNHRRLRRRRGRHAERPRPPAHVPRAPFNKARALSARVQGLAALADQAQARLCGGCDRAMHHRNQHRYTLVRLLMGSPGRLRLQASKPHMDG